jgi:hypothetical protein
MKLMAMLLAGLILLIPACAFAQAATKPPDLNGFWTNQYTPNLATALGHEPPYTPYGLERWTNVDTKDDPTGQCLPVGPSRAFTAPMPFQIVQSPKLIAFLFEYQTIYRMVYMDGRPHPQDILDYPEFMGHSTGRWEGDTLVIDTVGINERSWLDTAGHEHSEVLHLTERMQKIDDNHIQWTVTYDDPVFFTEPWSITRTFTRGKETDRIMAYSCEENNKDVEHLRSNKKPLPKNE